MYFDARDVSANKSKWYESFNEKTMTIRVEVACDDESYEELKETISTEAYKLISPEDYCVTLPMKFSVCPLCNGKGSHVNPSIDAHGISSDEWDRDWDYEEREMYMNGGYNVTCYECDGRRVVPEINTDIYHLTPAIEEIKKLIDSDMIEERSYVHMCMTERAMGA